MHHGSMHVDEGAAEARVSAADEWSCCARRAVRSCCARSMRMVARAAAAAAARLMA